MLDKTFFSDEAWFHLSGYVSSQILEFGPVKIRMNLLRSFCIP